MIDLLLIDTPNYSVHRLQFQIVNNNSGDHANISSILGKPYVWEIGKVNSKIMHTTVVPSIHLFEWKILLDIHPSAPFYRYPTVQFPYRIKKKHKSQICNNNTFLILVSFLTGPFASERLNRKKGESINMIFDALHFWLVMRTRRSWVYASEEKCSCILCMSKDMCHETASLSQNHEIK